ncbi:uncharacterized protein EI90DRAFT_1965472 [Cantharellus anzutake]|uniref:uncharacterized protein n=1 Tax=Cantharellus anzutake TaxID=1750568 RepID=UPI001903FEAA|nr:uncharacterized protein EI90DRAFT_1965472 [Cantharellus anzutake]KAF8326209.1 hypothetical protein EI90DRAFT_1965472 [Cantharellus anzutake]
MIPSSAPAGALCWGTLRNEFNPLARMSEDLVSSQLIQLSVNHDKPRLIITAFPVEATKAFLYVIEGIAAYPDRLSIAEKITSLRRREVGWANLKWRSQTYTVLANPSPYLRLYELQHGFFAYGYHTSGTYKDPDCLSLHPLPRVADRLSNSMAHGLSSALLESIDSERQMYLEGGDGDDIEIDWSQTPILHHLDFGYRQFSIDPEQNLVIYVCHDSDRMIVRIRQMSDNAFHPMARYETLDIRWMLRGNYIYLEIFGDFVGVMILQYGDRNHHFSIWNWKTGICQCSCTAGPVLSLKLQNMKFYSEETRCLQMELFQACPPHQVQFKIPPQPQSIRQNGGVHMLPTDRLFVPGRTISESLSFHLV